MILFEVAVQHRLVSLPDGPVLELPRKMTVHLLVEGSHHDPRGPEIETMGLKMGHLSEIVFDDCRVPAVNTFGSAGDAARLLTITWNGNRPLCGLAATHLAQKALDKATVYAGERTQFGKAIGGHQLVQKLLADIETNVVTSRLLCYYALHWF